jgi:hypothetical protein
MLRRVDEIFHAARSARGNGRKLTPSHDPDHDRPQPQAPILPSPARQRLGASSPHDLPRYAATRLPAMAVPRHTARPANPPWCCVECRLDGRSRRGGTTIGSMDSSLRFLKLGRSRDRGWDRLGYGDARRLSEGRWKGTGRGGDVRDGL